jgi:hypothetical protein
MKSDGTPSCGTADGIRIADSGEDAVLLPAEPIGTLIGRWDDGPWFRVGTQADLTVPAGAAWLVLQCNDRDGFFDDNTGRIEVGGTVSWSWD